MPRSVAIATINGTAIRLHWSFVLLLALITFGAFLSNGILAAAQVALLVSLIFGCVVLHEFGHITMAEIWYRDPGGRSAADRRARQAPTHSDKPKAGTGDRNRWSNRELRSVCVAGPLAWALA